MARTKKDLPAKKTVKGGRLGANDNLTLVRGAKPKKDLPARKPVTGGRKAGGGQQDFLIVKP